jgi:hypothetical protein
MVEEASLALRVGVSLLNLRDTGTWVSPDGTFLPVSNATAASSEWRWPRLLQ